MASLRRLTPLALALLAAICLSGCAAGEEGSAGVVQSPSEQVHEFVRDVASEGGESAEEELAERRAEYEEAQEEREEAPGEAGEEAAAEGAEARDAWQSHEEELQAAEEPAVDEREPGVGRMLREG